MANRNILLCLLVAYLCVYITECRRSGGGGRSGGSRSGGRSSSSHSHSWGHSSHGSSSSHSSGSHGYPSSHSGLSGSGSGKASYPSSSSGLSGSGKSSSGSSFYPSSSSGLSGTGNHRPSYPTGSSSNNYRPPHGTSYHPSSSYNNNHGSTYHGDVGYHNPVHTIYHSPTYYSSPQHIYVHEYRNSGSRYGDLLTGLTLYNLGRSHSNYHHHYYYDDYYRRRYDSPSSSYRSESRPENSAVCTLRIQENEKLEMLKIPCEIVSTFTEGSRKDTHESVTNTTVCVTNSTTVNNTMAAKGLSPSAIPAVTTTDFVTSTSPVGVIGISSTVATTTLSNATPTTSIVPSNLTSVVHNVSSNGYTVMNSTSCTTNFTVTDPMTVKGPSVNPSNMKCSVEIKTKEASLRNEVDCKVLMEYAKMPEPKKENDAILPPRSKLKSWLQKPPWWLSMFIAV